MKKALIVVDMQNDFFPGGALAVPEGDTVLPFIIAAIRSEGVYDLVVFTQDYHPKGHGSFASAHPGAAPFQLGELAGLPQMLWPDHCVEGTRGADLVEPLEKVVKECEALGRQILFVRKGQSKDVDSYSAFFDNNRRHDTGLHRALVNQAIGEVDVGGLALDYCVKATAIDASSLGFRTCVLLEGTRLVDPSSLAQVLLELTQAGVSTVSRR